MRTMATIINTIRPTAITQPNSHPQQNPPIGICICISSLFRIYAAQQESCSTFFENVSAAS